MTGLSLIILLAAAPAAFADAGTVSVSTRPPSQAELAPAQAVNIPAAVSALKGKNYSAKMAAILNLAKTRDSGAVPELLRQYMREKDSGVKAKILEAASAFGDSALMREAAGELLTSTDTRLRYSAVYALGYSPSGAAVPSLLAIFRGADEPKPLRMQAANALSRFPREDVYAAFVEALSDGDPEMRRQAAVSLSLCFAGEPDRVRPHLEKLRSDPETAETAETYLEMMGPVKK